MYISYQCNHTICDFCVWLFLFMEHNVFKFHLCCSPNQRILLWITPLYGWVTFHSMDVAQFVYVKGRFLGIHFLPLVSTLAYDYFHALTAEWCPCDGDHLLCKVENAYNVHPPPPALLRYNWHKPLCKFKACNMMIWCRYILQKAYHNKVS